MTATQSPARTAPSGPDPDRVQPASPWPLVAAELGLLALALGTTATFARLFQGWAFLESLAVLVVASWAIAIGLRRLRVGAGVATALSLAIGLSTLAWRFAPDTTTYGLPTPGTASAFAELVRSSFGDFAEQVAPVPASQGFLLTLGAVLWVFVFFADTSALRYRAPVQAVIPYLATVVASGVLARDAARVGATLTFALGLGVYTVTQRVLRADSARWLAGDSRRGVRAVAVGATAVAVVVLAAGVAVAPLLPGDDDAVVDLRSLGRGDGPRTVVSPFVGVTSLLGERSDEVVFSVAAAEPTYWRLTALEQYDPARSIWTSRGTYRSTDGDLGDVPGGRPLAQEFRIASLGGLWLPAAFEAASVRGDVAVGVDTESASLIARDETARAGTTYQVESRLRVVDPATVGPGPGPPTDPATVAPEGISDEVRIAAELAVAGATNPYDQALAIQDWLRRPGATYDTTVDYRGEPDPVAAFLRERRGFCQQFASTFALMARSVGLPSRVAVGFTPGDLVAAGDGGPARFVVRGRHAHAWPEVELPGVGWVAFEPTPGRGDPQTESYTGVTGAQAEPPVEQAATTSTTSTTVAGNPPTTAPDAADLEVGADATVPDGADAATGSDSGPGRPVGVVAVIGLLLAAAASVAVVRWRRTLARRRERDDPRTGPVALAWNDVVRACGLRGVVARPDETPLEFARRAAVTTELDDVSIDVTTLARLETARRYGPEPPTGDQVDLAEEIARQVVAAVDSGLPARDRVLERLR